MRLSFGIIRGELFKIFPDYKYSYSTPAVRGMMYYQKALELQAFLDMAKDEGTKSKRFYEYELTIIHIFIVRTTLILQI